ncbi:unnamed protein product [Symbiodinium necroappetens]|uniref:Uncharacterized protein n=1 Tax=Symbiodinium necroappetens TaxID=1628268 RepID=A0A812RGZ4_9DINO|nr:unnamed protein product [Symbiodinium necroappetens]
MEKYRPAEMRNSATTSKAYLRRQLLLSEVDNVRNSLSTDIWRDGLSRPRYSGATTEVIHRDIR